MGSRNYRYIGKSIPRVDAEAKATGEAVYTVDVNLPGLLVGRLLRSPHPHARILHIDTSRAERLPGVRAVVTGRDTPYRFGVSHFDQSPLQLDKVRHVGDPLAAVAAVDADAALEACERIRVEYEELPAVFDPEEALRPGAPEVHEGTGNVACRIERGAGDVDAALARADHVFEHRFVTQRQAHCSPEVHNCVAQWDAAGRLTVYFSSQAPSMSRSQFAEALGIPESKVRVVTNHVGSGFGSKAVGKFPMEFAAIALARKTGRPVRIECSREDEFALTTFRHAVILDFRTGVMADGTIVARDLRALLDNGAYCDYGPVTCNLIGAKSTLTYRLDHYRYEGLVAYTNNPYGGALRGLGNPQFAFASESQMDMIAHELGIDPVELRLKNAVHAGYTTPAGVHFASCGLTECIERASRAIGWDAPRPRPASPTRRRGRGIACASHNVSSRLSPGKDIDFAEAKLTLNDDGSAVLATGCCEIGTGSSTVYAQMAGEVLGIEPSLITVVHGDTDATPKGWGSRAQRNTVIGGLAVCMAAESCRDQLLAVGARLLEAAAEDLELAEGWIRVRGAPSRGVSVAEAVRSNRYREGGGAIQALAHYDAPSELTDPVTGKGNYAISFTFCAKAVEVEVDMETGVVTVERAVTAHDLGRAINPLGAVCQMEGGVSMGLGFALAEELALREGRIQNPDFTGYVTQTALDVPAVECILVETEEPKGPFGAKAVGEIAGVGVAPAVANAIFDAIGVRITELPLTPERVLRAIEGQGKALHRSRAGEAQSSGLSSGSG